MKNGILIRGAIALLGVFAMAVALPTSVFGEVPKQISYQGMLTDDLGDPLTGDQVIVFSIYDVATGGAAFWWEEQTVTITNGVYNVQIGQDPVGNPFPAGLFDDRCWLGVAVGTDTEMTPRQPITSVPFALMADRVSSGAVTEVMLADDAVTTAKIADSTITGEKIATSTIPASDIQDGSGSGLDADKLDGLEATDFITGVNAGTGLSGGGPSGTVTLDVSVPLSLEGSLNAGVISGFNTSQYGFGLYGYASGLYGKAVRGEATGASGNAIRGIASNAGDCQNYGGYFGAHGKNGIGVRGHSAGEYGFGVYGIATGLFGRGVYGEAPDTGYAGYFEGKIFVNNGIEFPDGTVQTTAAAPTWYKKLPAAERFELVMEGEAVMDKETGLVWARDANLFGTSTWTEAIIFCANLSISDRKGWRLPAEHELASLLDMSVSESPMLPDGYEYFFENVQSWSYWSRDTYEADNNWAWHVSMNYGTVGPSSKTYSLYVWPVRSGF